MIRRIGKDIRVKWRILTNGKELPLHGRDLRLEVVNRFGRKEWEFTIEDENVVVFTLPGRLQRYLGEYTFTLWENFGKAGQTAVDSCGGIELVPTTCMEGGDSGPDTEPVELETASLELGVSGASAYETWLAEGHEGTEEDFLAWLRQPATDAADNALDAAEAATDAAAKAEAATEEMEQLYGVALAAESERQTAEQERVKAEQERAAEFARLKEESEAATRAANEAAESGGSVATTGLLQLLLEHPDEPYTLTEEEVQSVFGGIENFHKAISGLLAIKDVLDLGGQNGTIMLQPEYTAFIDDILTGLWGMDEEMIGLGFKSNYIVIQENNGAVSIGYVNVVGLFYELPGSIYSITDESTPEELEEILGDREDLSSAIRDGKLIISAYYSGNGPHSAEIVEANQYSRDYAVEYIDFKTRNRLVSVNLQGNGDGYNKATVTDITPQPKEDIALMTTDKTVVGAINEINSSLPVYTTVPELTTGYTIPDNPTNVEHIYYITIGDTVYNVTGADGIKWVDGIAPVAAANTTLVVSVINNLAVWGGF